MGNEMRADQACQALASGKCIEVRYDGFGRVVEVHAVGRSTAGNPVMRVWQVEGGSASNNRVGWKLMRLDETQFIGATDRISEAPRDGYKRGDRGMSTVDCEI